jgi:hypothetical protein
MIEVIVYDDDSAEINAKKIVFFPLSPIIPGFAFAIMDS